MALESTLNMKQWIEENKHCFVPPVGNKMMYDGQLKVFFVGGPNIRKDYHIDEGEEFFHMIKGDMCLKIMEKGKPKDVPIKEGEVFVLPSRIQHSPQRKEGTIGLVIERERLPEEIDGLRYYCEDGVTPLYERWFHCTDLGAQLVPVIKGYFASEEHRTGVPGPDSIADVPPTNINHVTEVDKAFSLKKWIDENRTEIANGSKKLFNKGELKITIHGSGEQTDHWSGETWLWQLEGNATLTVGNESRKLAKDDVIIVPAGAKFTVTRDTGSIGMSVIMDPLANKANNN